MTERKMFVPDGMKLAVQNNAGRSGRVLDWDLLTRDLAAALRWLSENPIVPTREVIRQLWNDPFPHGPGTVDRVLWVVTEWQRRMFQAPDEDEELSAEGWLAREGYSDSRPHPSPAIAALLEKYEAYRRGKESK